MASKPVWRWVVVALALLLLTAACSPESLRGSRTEEALRHADALQSAVEAFERSRSETSHQINEATNKIIHDLNEPGRETEAGQPVTELDAEEMSDPGVTIELRGLALTWETEWRDVHARFTELENNFATVGKRSQRYFEELERLTEEISDPQLRSAEQEKNRALKQAWTEAYTQAARDIDALRGVIRTGNDIERLLQVNALRAMLSEDIKHLEEISAQAQVLLGQLERLTIEGRRLTGGQPEGVVDPGQQ